MTFFITGLPRSRTAWWSVVTGADHEGFSRNGWADWSRGLADSGAGMHINRIILADAPRTLIVERPRAEVYASLCTLLNGVTFDADKLTRYLERLETALRYDHPLIKRVAFADLTDIGVVRECLDWLNVDPPAQLDQFMRMRVESDLAWNLARVGRAA